MRARGAADAVIGGAHVRDPVADRLVHRVLQRARSGIDRAHLDAEQAHARDVGRLPLDVLGAHVDDALEAEQRAHGRGRHAVLPRAGLRDDALLAHPAREQRLSERVVQLVRAGVEQVLPLEQEARADAQRLREPGCVGQRSGPSRVVLQERRQLFPVRRVGARRPPGGLELVQRRDERLGHEAPAVGAEAAARIGELARLAGEERQHALHSISRAAARAAATKSRTRPGSLKPSGPSIPEATSTPSGRAARMACATFSGASPPLMNTSAAKSSRALRASDQANETPPPPPAGPSSRTRRNPRSPASRSSAASPSTWRAAYRGSAPAGAGSLPWSCTAESPTSPATRSASARSTSWNTPTSRASSGSAARISRAVLTVTQRRLRGANTTPTSSAPACAHNPASRAVRTPHSLMRTRVTLAPARAWRPRGRWRRTAPRPPAARRPPARRTGGRRPRCVRRSRRPAARCRAPAEPARGTSPA